MSEIYNHNSVGRRGPLPMGGGRGWGAQHSLRCDGLTRTPSEPRERRSLYDGLAYACVCARRQ
eukprot:4142144-Pyramimonas_sp.AAC.1